MRPLPKGKLPVERQIEAALEQIDESLRAMDATLAESGEFLRTHRERMDDIHEGMRSR